MDTIQFCFEGTMKVTCNRCHKSHELVFDGDEQSTLGDAIEEALTTAGWHCRKIICPDCYDPLDSTLDADEIDEEDYFEDIDTIFEEDEE
jgi:hypothetical protein